MNSGTNQVIVASRPPTPKQFGELSRAAHGKLAELLAAYYESTTFDDMQARLTAAGGVAEPIGLALAPIFSNPDPDYALREYWRKFYAEHLGMELAVSEVVITELPGAGKWRHVFVAPGLSVQHVAKAFGKVLRTYDSRWGINVASELAGGDNTAGGSYSICVRNAPECDSAFDGVSADKADPDQTLGVKLLEHLLHGMVHFVETKQHLNVRSRTLCSGSVHNGMVPFVHWSLESRCLFVRLTRANNGQAGFGIRQKIHA